MADKITLQPKGFRAFAQPMGMPQEGQHVKLMHEGKLREFAVRNGKLWPVERENGEENA